VRLGQPRLHLRATGSTSDEARALAAHGAPHGTLVTAAQQTAGRGRQGRAWVAPAGRALLCSLVLRDPGELVSLAAGVAVAELAGAQARIKWPNDVLVDGRKVAGILVEGRPQEEWAVLGIGINVALRPQDFPPELRERAGTLGREVADIEPLLATLLAALERWLNVSDAEVLDAVRARDALLGREVSWAAGTGVAAGIDDQGRLLVRTGSETVALDAGEMHLGDAPGA
jgi:BirA family transcriptional regulator, biotin operon repressor / biotin---[acetyl-CoA-carboxylase] ligase